MVEFATAYSPPREEGNGGIYATESQYKFAIGDAILVVGTRDDGKVGTIIRLAKDHQYVVALEDGSEVLLSAEDMTLRR